MSLNNIIAGALKGNIVNGAGFWRSPDGIFEATYLPDEGTGYIDIVNPGDKYKFPELKAKALKYIKSLPQGKWQFNPDTPQKGRIYGQRIFKGVKGVTPNPSMPNNALILNTIKAPPVKQTIMKVKPKPNLKVKGGFGSDFDHKNINPSDRPSETGMPRFNLPGKVQTPDGMVWPLV